MLRYISVRLSKFSVNRILRVGIFVIGLIVIAGLFTRVVWKSSAANAGRSLQGASVTPSRKQRIEAELIVLGPNGFEPKQIKRDVGKPFLLLVENRSGSPVVSLALESDVGARVLATPLSREKRLWSDVLHLPRGAYTLKESDHSDWICTISVE